MHRLTAVIFLLAAPLLAFAQRDVDPPRRIEGRAVVVRATRALSAADQADLAASGVTIKHALPGGRYLARVAAGASVTDARIETIEDLTPEKKMHPSAIRAAAQGRPMADVNVVFHRDVPFDEARQAILAAGGAMDVLAVDYLPPQRIEARIPSSSLLALAGDDRVLTIAAQRRLKVESHNATSAAVSRVPEVQKAPYGLTGAGVAVSLFELAEAQADHVEFGGRLTIASTTAGGTFDDRRHATHVAGTIGAAGVRADAKGMAPGATIHQFCVPVSGTNNCTNNYLRLKQDRLAPLNVRVDNNSWGYIWGWQGTLWNDGDIWWGAYDLELAAPLDEVSNEKGVLFVHSAGNDGTIPSFGGDAWKSHRHVDGEGNEIETETFCVSQNGSGTDCPSSCNGKPVGCELQLHHPQTPYDTLGTTASAKNVIAVGAIDSSLNIISFSSRGPAKDGRVKPDVVARGASVLSSVPTNAYGTSSGTSMSAPAVTGIAALLTEQWRRSFGGADPTPAQLKALLIAGADDLGNPGPDYTFGFGLVNAKASVDLILADERAGARIRNATFAEGAQDVVEIPLVLEKQQTLRVVLNWPDPAIPYLGGDPVAEQALVNDLDLRVIDPSGNVRLPYVLDRVNFTANATTGVNKVDNVEMVEIPNASPGVYRVVASGTRVTEGPQAAVIVSNVRTARPCRDTFEAFGNDSAQSAFGNIVSGAAMAGGFCTAGDVDYFKFVATKTGPLTVTVTAGDTPVRVTVTGNGISQTLDVPASSTRTLNATVSSVPNTVVVKVEAAGALGLEPQYSFIATYPEQRTFKRRSSRR